MRNAGAWIFLFLLVGSFCQAQDYGRETRLAMEEASRACQGVPPLSNPPSPFDVRIYKKLKGEAIEKLDALAQIDPNAEKSKTELFGLPFDATVARARKVIAANDALLAKVKVDDVEPDAREKVDAAIGYAEMCVKWMADPKKYNASFSGLKEYYGYYKKALADAESLDARAVEERKVKLAQLEESFVKPYLVLASRVDEQKAVEKAVQEYESQAQAKERASARSSESDRRSAIAKGRGFEKASGSVRGLLMALGDGRVSPDDAKKYLVFVEPGFTVLNTSGEHIFYVTDERRGEDQLTVAVLREEGQFYGDNAPLRTDLVSVAGFGRFTTALGTDRDLVVLKALPKLTDDERRGKVSVAAPKEKPVLGPCGIGIGVRKAPGQPLLVTGLVPNGEAEKAGIKVLDKITAVDGRDITPLNDEEASALIRGEEGTAVALTVNPADGGPSREVTAKRAPLAQE